MIEAWRIIREKYIDHKRAFSGEGAAKSGERWNHISIPVVYASGHLSLAALERFVKGKYLRLGYFRLEIPDNIIEVVEPGRLPSNWRSVPATDSTKDFGTRWVKENRSAILRVPSAIIPVEYNFVLNPQHPDFKSSIKIDDPKPFSYDHRMWK